MSESEHEPRRGRQVLPLLDGLMVLELGDEVAGASAGAILHTLGATVHVVREPTSVLRMLEPQAPTIDGAPSISLLAASLDVGKMSIDSRDATIGLGSGHFDVVVADRVLGASTLVAADADEHMAAVRSIDAGVWVTISAFGMSGGRRNWFGSDLVVSAAGGLLSSVRDPQTHGPIKLAGSQGLLAAGQAAALAACHGLSSRAGTTMQLHIDVSAQCAVLATGPVLQFGGALLNSTAASGAKRYGAPTGYYGTRDGVVRISAMEDHHWRGLATALEHPEFLERWPLAADRIRHGSEIDDAVAAVTVELTSLECEAMLQHHGVPATAMYGPAELLDSPQFAARDAFTTIDVSGRPGRVIRHACAVDTSSPAGTRPPPDRGSLEGLRVAEAGHVLAAPLAGALLGAMGANVLKLEEPKRLDMYRRRGPYVDDVAGLDNGVYFALMNHSKRSLVIDLQGDRLHLEELLGTCDVLIENLGPARAGKLHIDAASTHRAHPSVLAISCSGYGHVGPWSRYRTYAYNLHCACGLVHLTRAPGGGLVEMDIAWADLITGYVIATIVAAWAVGPSRGRGLAVDLAMAEVVAGRLSEFLLAQDISGTCAVEDGRNRQHPYAPHAVFDTADGRSIAIAVLTDEQWRALLGVLDPLDAEPALRAVRSWLAAQRISRLDELEALLAPVVARRNAPELTALLQRAKVPASTVERTAELVDDPTLGESGFFPEVLHPTSGLRKLVGLPWRIIGRVAAARIAPPPLLGDAGTAIAGTPLRDPWA